MSTILKALRRLEEERNARAERALREQVVSAAPRTPRRWPRLLLRTLGALAGLVLLSLGLERWISRPAAPPAPPAAGSAALPHPGGQPAAAPAGGPLASPPRPPLPVTPTQVSPLGPAGSAPAGPAASAPLGPTANSPTAAPPAPSVGEAGPLPGAARPSPADVRAAAAALAPRPDVAIVPRPAPTPPALSEGPPEAQAAASSAAPGSVPPLPRTAPSAAPSEPSSSDAEDAATTSVPIRLREIDPSLHSPYGIHESPPSKSSSSSHAKATHPSATSQEVVVTRTIWHPDSDRRVALVRGAGDPQEREVHEGESVGSLQVLRIEPSDVVFLRDGVEIRQRVGALR